MEGAIGIWREAACPAAALSRRRRGWHRGSGRGRLDRLLQRGHETLVSSAGGLRCGCAAQLTHRPKCQPFLQTNAWGAMDARRAAIPTLRASALRPNAAADCPHPPPPLAATAHGRTPARPQSAGNQPVVQPGCSCP